MPMMAPSRLRRFGTGCCMSSIGESVVANSVPHTLYIIHRLWHCFEERVEKYWRRAAPDPFTTPVGA